MMTQTQTDGVKALMTLFPPHPTGHGKLNGYKPDSNQKKNQWTETTAATQDHYLWHLTADQTEPHGIGQYAKQGDQGHWLCFDIDTKGEQGKHIAYLLLEELEARNLIPYLEESTRGGFHIFIWPEGKSINIKTLVKAGKAIQQQLKAQGVNEAIEIYPASYETNNEYGGKYVNLPYRGALNDPQEYGETFLVYGDMGIPLSELDQIEETPHSAIIELAKLHQEEKPNYNYTPPENALPEVWGALTQHLQNWTPKIGNRHEAMLAIAGAAKHANISQLEAETTLSQLTTQWFTSEEHQKRNVTKELKDIVTDTYKPNRKVTGVSTLRRLGANIPKLPASQTTNTITFNNIINDQPTLLKEIKEAINKLPKDEEEAIYQAATNGLFQDIAKLGKTEQSIAILSLKNRSGIGKTDAKTFINEAKNQNELSPTELRNMVLEAWETQGLKAKYIAEWQEWFIYENGVYKNTLIESVQKRVNTILEANGQNVLEYILKDVIAKLARSEGIYQERPPERNDYLNLKNGLLNLDTQEFTEHTPEVLTFAQAPSMYDPQAICPKFDAFLKRVLPDELHRLTLQEFLGYTLTSKTFLQKALYMKGAGGTGKGTTITVFQYLLTGEHGHGMSANMGIEDLNDGSPALVNALNKRLIYVSEVPAKANLIGFKKITGEDKVSLNPKYKRPYDIKLEAKIIITGNTWIHTGDDSANNSIDRRLIILPFDIIPKPEDYNPRIAEEMSTPEELAGLLNWALAGWQRLKENSYRFTSDGDSAKRMEFLEYSNPVISFLSETCDLVEDLESHSIGSAQLFEHWKNWCQGYEFNANAGKLNAFGSEKAERWKKLGGSGHYVGTNKGFTAKCEEALKILGSKAYRARASKGMIWYGVKYVGKF